MPELQRFQIILHVNLLEKDDNMHKPSIDLIERYVDY